MTHGDAQYSTCPRINYSDLRVKFREDTRYIYEYIAYKTVELAALCSKLGLKCVDVPVVVTYTLKHDLDLEDRDVRRVWHLLGKTILHNKLVRVFENDSFRFDLKLTLKKEPVYVHRDLNIPVGRSDVKSKLSCNYILIPRSHALYIDVEAKFSEQICIKINLVYLLKKLYELGFIELIENLLAVTLLVLRGVVFGRVHAHSILTRVSKISSMLRAFRDILYELAQIEVDDLSAIDIIVHTPYMRMLIERALTTTVEKLSR